MKTGLFLLLMATLLIPFTAIATSPEEVYKDTIPEELETVFRLHILSVALASYHDEFFVYPPIGSDLSPISDSLCHTLTDRLCSVIKKTDGWGNPFLIAMIDSQVVIVSPGIDGQIDEPERIQNLVREADGNYYELKKVNGLPGDDIIMVDGSVVKRYLNRFQRQKVTVAHIRTLATATQVYLTDYPALPCSGTNRIRPQNLVDLLQPTYINKKAPVRDGWDSELIVLCEGASFAIISPGADRKEDQQYVSITNLSEHLQWKKFQDARHDIIFINDGFRAWPEGIDIN